MRICEHTGQEPDPEKMPVSTSDLPEEVQSAFFILGLLEEKWDGMSGSFMGYSWNNLEYYINLYEVYNPKAVIYFMKMYEGILVGYRADKAAQKRKAEERKASAGSGKKYAHNVKL